jgi:hypothetical protein
MAKRPSAEQFRTQPLGDLAQQLRYAPRARRREQLERAERLHDEIDPAINYPFDYIAYRITRYRQPHQETVLLVGEAVLADLRAIIDLLSRLDPPAADELAVETPAALAARLEVSQRTLHRWREAGLRWRWVTLNDGGQPRIGFTHKAVEAFERRQGRRVQQASRFAHLTQAERAALVHRARRIASVTEASRHQVAAHLAKRTGRGSETIRQLLAQHDAAHPNDALFNHHTGPLTPKQQRIISRAYARGVPVGRLARRFRRHRATIYRTINEVRAAEARRQDLTFVSSPMFDRDDADAVLLRPGVEAEALARANPPAEAAADLPAALQSLYHQPRVRDEDQRSLLLRYNYLKYKAATVRDQLDRHQPRAGQLDELEAHLGEATQLRDLLVRINLPTVLSVARRHLVDKPDPGQRRLLHLLALGHRVLGETIEAYDPARSQPFGANLANRLMRRFANDPTITDQPPAKAHRRRSGDEALAFLIDEARQAGVNLPRVDEVSSRSEP